MYVRDPLDWTPAGGGSGGARAFGRADVPDVRTPAALATPGEPASWTVDLTVEVGSGRWWRGLATCMLLVAMACLLAPRLPALEGAVPAPLAGVEAQAARALTIVSLGRGGDGGRRLAPTASAVPVARVPERARIGSVVTIGVGDTLGRLLLRAGASAQDARDAEALVAHTGAVLSPGLRVTVTFGSRPDLFHPRPLDALALRPRIDLALALTRAGGRLFLSRPPVAIDRAPLRLGGVAGTGLYEAIRAAGVPAEAAADYLKAIAPRVPFGEVTPTDAFDLVIERTRVASGETRWGRLLFAGFGTGPHALRLVRWTPGTRDGNGHDGWYDADGQTQRQQGSLGMPVAGHITSGFGMRFHPILGYSRMHKGIDIGAPVGTPVFAVIDGTVLSAGWTGGYGNFIRLAHGGGMGSGYGHLSRVAVRAGEAVRRGQVIGYVGSTGMSTGPHLHWEITRGGVAVDPLPIAQAGMTTLEGAAMPAFRARVAWLMGLKRGG
ncbi:M23 family metallopeptidase [Sphingomonas bacterium]|uniref:M23 family metallopeptidase n=1 Tax=Sphingomonas bacterium TaxID=1895847 RepID=UPI0015767048|nr:M23 family metallopeptidase [Sphingomonas bacterium]